MFWQAQMCLLLNTGNLTFSIIHGSGRAVKNGGGLGTKLYIHVVRVCYCSQTSYTTGHIRMPLRVKPEVALINAQVSKKPTRLTYTYIVLVMPKLHKLYIVSSEEGCGRPLCLTRECCSVFICSSVGGKGGQQQCSLVPRRGGGEASSSVASYPGVVEGRPAAV